MDDGDRRWSSNVVWLFRHRVDRLQQKNRCLVEVDVIVVRDVLMHEQPDELNMTNQLRVGVKSRVKFQVDRPER